VRIFELTCRIFRSTARAKVQRLIRSGCELTSLPKMLAMFEIPQPTVHTAAGMKKIRKILQPSRVTSTSPYPGMRSPANTAEAEERSAEAIDRQDIAHTPVEAGLTPKRQPGWVLARCTWCDPSAPYSVPLLPP
jgi:hypothetical protein